jgi:putative transposase
LQQKRSEIFVYHPAQEYLSDQPAMSSIGVNRQGYYHYRRHTENKPVDPEHQEMLRLIKKIASETNNTYGSRRMKKAMNILGFPISRSKARKLMKEAGVEVRYRKKHKVTTNSDHQQPVFDNLVQRQFDVKETDRVYVADITYIWTQEGWLYLAV